MTMPPIIWGCHRSCSHTCVFVCVQTSSPCGLDGGSCEQALVGCLGAQTPVCVHHVLSVLTRPSLLTSILISPTIGLWAESLWFFFKNVSWKHFWAEHLAFASSHQWMHLWGAWHTPLLQMQGWKAGAAISELVSAWFVYPWILKPAIVMCRRRSNTSSAWKYRNTESWVRARLNHCATPSSSPSLAQNTATIFELKLTLYLYKGIQL